MRKNTLILPIELHRPTGRIFCYQYRLLYMNVTYSIHAIYDKNAHNLHPLRPVVKFYILSPQFIRIR